MTILPLLVCLHTGDPRRLRYSTGHRASRMEVFFFTATSRPGLRIWTYFCKPSNSTASHITTPLLQSMLSHTMEEVAVVVVPFPAQGHLNQLLHLSLILSSHGLPVHYAASVVHTRQARSRIHGWPPESISNICFLNIPIPAFAAPPPDPAAPSPFPTHLLPAFEASEHLRVPLAAVIRSLSASHRRVIIIQESVMSFAGADAASLPNIEIYTFVAIPTYFHLPYMWDPKSALQVTQEVRAIIEAPFEDNIAEEFLEFAIRRHQANFRVAGSLHNTSRVIEAEFIHLYQNLQEGGPENNKIYAVGPLNPVTVHGGGGNRHQCLNWLDRQPEGSVVYVSFGTTSVMSEEQIVQLAMGLKSSGQRFIWVLRDADKGDIFADGQKRELLPGFEEEVEGVGMVVREWAPQLEILSHASTGVFLSHCGWNSCMESLSMGVPLLTWPMHTDQPRNAMVMTEYLKIGVEVREWARRKETVMAAEVAEAVKKVMVSDQGKEIRTKAKELSKAIRGASQADLSTFIVNITR